MKHPATKSDEGESEGPPDRHAEEGARRNGAIVDSGQHLSTPRQVENRLLAALPSEDRLRVLALCERVELAVGETILKAGERVRHIYFPLSAVIALECVTASGAGGTSAVIGSDGMVGAPLLMGSETATTWAVVINAGAAFRAEGAALRREFARAGEFHRLTLRYLNALLCHVTQTALCNRHHSLEQQLCRVLLSGTDAVQADELVTTHERIATVLGVRRESVTEAAGHLQRAGTLACKRGRILVLDRNNLKARACECYGVLVRLWSWAYR